MSIFQTKRSNNKTFPFALSNRDDCVDTTCPDCDSPAVMTDGGLICSNDNCSSQG